MINDMGKYFVINIVVALLLTSPSMAQLAPPDAFPVSIYASNLPDEFFQKLQIAIHEEEPWYKEYQTALTGLAAIAAALVALLGVRQQVNAISTAESQKHEKNIEAISAAFWSELQHAKPNIQSQISIIKSFLEDAHIPVEAIELLPVETPVFDVLKGEIGKLPPTVSFAVVGVYALVRHYSMRMARGVPSRVTYEVEVSTKTPIGTTVNKVKCINRNYLESLQRQLEAILKNLILTAEKLAQLAKVDPNTSAAIFNN